MQEAQDIQMYFYVDESGDPTILGRKGCNLLELGLVSKTFIVGYHVLWTVNRVYEQGDFRYYRFLKEKISLVQDIFDLAKYPKTYYTPEYPLEPNKMSPVGG